MKTDLENTWKSIFDSAASQDAEVTYKTNKYIDVNSDELPTVTLTYLKCKKLNVKPQETIDLSHATEIDTFAPTEQTYIGNDASEKDTGITNPTLEDVEIDSIQPTIMGQLDIEEDDNETVSDMDNTRSSFEEDSFVLPLMTTQQTLKENSKESKVWKNNPSFEIYEEIARGGMGVILKGQQNSLKRNIAVKKLINDSPEKLLSKKKFIMEARVTAYLDHPNIIPIHELGMDGDNNPIITMKLVKGKSWKQVLDQHKRKKYDPRYVNEHLGILINVCNALSYAHSKKIVHNDLKPANVMIGEFGEVFLMDWGIAISIAEDSKDAPTTHKLEVDSPMGTPNYMAPELANGEGEKISEATDVYLLGGILYRVLMGTAPHHAGNVWESIRLSSIGNIPSFDEDIPDHLQRICKRALSKEPQDRYKNIEAFKNDIREFQNHWESVQITKEATEFLDIGFKIIEMFKANKTIEEVRNIFPNPYCPLSRSLFGFEEALRIWPENAKAKQGKADAFCVYTEVAIYNEDFNVANAVIEKIDDIQQAGKLRKQLDIAREKHLNCVNTIRKSSTLKLKIAVVSIFLVGLGILIGKLI